MTENYRVALCTIAAAFDKCLSRVLEAKRAGDDITELYSELRRLETAMHILLKGVDDE